MCDDRKVMMRRAAASQPGCVEGVCGCGVCVVGVCVVGVDCVGVGCVGDVDSFGDALSNDPCCPDDNSDDPCCPPDLLNASSSPFTPELMRMLR